MASASRIRDPVPRDGTRGPRGRRVPSGTGVAVLPALAVLALAGCGGQAQEVRDALAYTAEVNRVQAGFERDLTGLQTAAARAEVPADVRRAVDRLSRQIVGVQSDLGRITPPGDVATLHRELIAAFGRWTAPLRRFREALSTKGAPGGLAGARRAFLRDSSGVERGIGTAAGRINDRLRDLSD